MAPPLPRNPAGPHRSGSQEALEICLMATLGTDKATVPDPAAGRVPRAGLPGVSCGGASSEGVPGCWVTLPKQPRGLR